MSVLVYAALLQPLKKLFIEVNNIGRPVKQSIINKRTEIIVQFHHHMMKLLIVQFRLFTTFLNFNTKRVSHKQFYKNFMLSLQI